MSGGDDYSPAEQLGRAVAGLERKVRSDADAVRMEIDPSLRTEDRNELNPMADRSRVWRRHQARQPRMRGRQ